MFEIYIRKPTQLQSLYIKFSEMHEQHNKLIFCIFLRVKFVYMKNKMRTPLVSQYSPWIENILKFSILSSYSDVAELGIY